MPFPVIIVLIVFGVLAVSHLLHFTEWVLGRLSQLRLFVGVYFSQFNGFDFYGTTFHERVGNGGRRLLVFLFSGLTAIVVTYAGLVVLIVNLCGVRIHHPDTLLFAVVTLIISLRFAVYVSGEPLGQVVSWLVTCLGATLLCAELALVIRHVLQGFTESGEAGSVSANFLALLGMTNALPNNGENMATCILMFFCMEFTLGRNPRKEHIGMEGATLGCMCLSRAPSSVPVIGRERIVQTAAKMISEARTSIDWLTSTNDPRVLRAIKDDAHKAAKVRIVSNGQQQVDIGEGREYEHFHVSLPIKDGFLVVDGRQVLKTCGRLLDGSYMVVPPHLGFFSEALAEVATHCLAFEQALSLSDKIKP